MISILIPVYNYDVRALIGELQRQIEEVEEECEIICYDDASDDQYLNLNSEISNLPNVTYAELESNLGRAKIRNKLASDASGDYLLFLDCDVSLTSDDFIKRYAESIENHQIVVGGIVYTTDQPTEAQQLLRWKYGREREEATAEVRSKNPYYSFLSANFLISKKLFMSIQFDESIEQYGYEDILLGNRLQEVGGAISHIENPVQHDGLESAEEFILKVGQSVQTLAVLIGEGKIIGGVRLYRAYQLLKSFGTQKLFLIYYRKSVDNWISNLKSDNPNIRNLDMYKLGKLIEEMG